MLESTGATWKKSDTWPWRLTLTGRGRLPNSDEVNVERHVTVFFTSAVRSKPVESGPNSFSGLSEQHARTAFYNAAIESQVQRCTHTLYWQRPNSISFPSPFTYSFHLCVKLSPSLLHCHIWCPHPTPLSSSPSRPIAIRVVPIPISVPILIFTEKNPATF